MSIIVFKISFLIIQLLLYITLSWVYNNIIYVDYLLLFKTTHDVLVLKAVSIFKT